MSLPAGVHPTLANWIGETKGYYAISRLIKHNNGRVPPLFINIFLIGMFSRNILNQCPFYMSLLFIPTFYHEDQYFMEIWEWICKVSDPYHELGLLANFSKYDFLFENAFQKDCKRKWDIHWLWPPPPAQWVAYKYLFSNENKIWCFIRLLLKYKKKKI